MKISRILVANRGEIVIRVVRAAHELGIPCVAVYSEQDRLSLHRFAADEAVQIGAGKTPVNAYLGIDELIQVAIDTHADAIHPGYGFLSENPEFAEQCAAHNIKFIGPSPDVMRKLGNKVDARKLAQSVGVPVIPASAPLPDDANAVHHAAAAVGLPVMLKASWGGGGRGMRVIREVSEVIESVTLAKREAKAYFGNDEVYFEKLIEQPRHVEVQILGDHHGNVIHLFERDCSLQRRHQKMLERAPAPYLEPDTRDELCAAAVTLARGAGLDNAGTVEFLYDETARSFYFIEVNPRVQVEHTVTEEVTGIDVVKSQIRIADGAELGAANGILPAQENVAVLGHALQCRVTTEDPANNFIPDYGHIVAYRSPAGPGVRLDAGTAYSGALITRHYDSLLVKVTTRGGSEQEAVARMGRAIREFRVRGVATNLAFLEKLLNHPEFISGNYDTGFIDRTEELFEFDRRRDHAERLLQFIGDVTVNGNDAVKDRARPAVLQEPSLPPLPEGEPEFGGRQILREQGPEAVARWMKDSVRPLVTDTTFRDAHQSLMATRMRTRDMLRIAPFYSHAMPELFSVESWGGATFDVALRFLKEDPWERLAELRDLMPNIMQQMLLRASNAVGYTNYPDNVVKYFVQEAATTGVDVFRIFDSLNWFDNMRVAIDAAGETGKLVEAAICYTGDILDPDRSKFDLNYYVSLAKKIEKTGAHVLGIKDMAGLVKPQAARKLVTALKDAVDMPIHFHTHDTSGIAAASVIAAVEAGVDAFDAAIDSMSGLTSQPNLGSIVAALQNTDRATGLNPAAIRQISDYFEDVRAQYCAFDPGIKSGASEVYVHEMPGGQYTNLKEQARSLGVGARWSDVANAYRDVNDMFGDIVKVTPSSKVVGDMALAMVTGGLSREDVEDPNRSIAFPESVVAFFHGDLGQPPGGFPAELQAKVLAGEKSLTDRPGSKLPPVDFDEIRSELKTKIGREPSDTDLASYLMYPDVFVTFAEHYERFGDVSELPTHVFFYGMHAQDEIAVNLAHGKTPIIRYLSDSATGDDGMRRVFFEVNGQPITVLVQDREHGTEQRAVEKADPNNPGHVAAPMPGLVVEVNVTPGQRVKRGNPVAVIEAMKMQTAVPTDCNGIVRRVIATTGHVVDVDELLIEIEIDDE